MSDIYVTKSTGERELFDISKLERSLARANTSTFLIEDILKSVQKSVKNGMTTKKIYENAFKLLHKKNSRSAYRYSIKRSLLSLGPTGFPFEQFLGAILEKKGYQVKIGEHVDGQCTTHEVDIVAHNKKDLIVAEVKFHNDISAKTDTKVGLYVKARFDDIKRTIFDFGDGPQTMTKGMIITNTKFTHSAVKYAECCGIEMLSWDYPQNGNLYDLIEETNLHPLTCLTTLPKAHKQILLDKGVVACKSLERDVKLLNSLSLSRKKKDSILNEIKNVCH